MKSLEMTSTISHLVRRADVMHALLLGSAAGGVAAAAVVRRRRLNGRRRPHLARVTGGAHFQGPACKIVLMIFTETRFKFI